MKKILRYWIYILVLASVSFACSSKDSLPQPKEFLVDFDQKEISLKEGKRETLTVKFNEEASKLDYDWSSSNLDVLSIENTDKNQAVIRGLSIGSAIVKLESTNKEVAAQCEVVVTERGVIKILAIGNSFTQDAVETNLYELAKAAGIDLTIGSITKGGSALATHWQNISQDKADYSYLKIVGETRTRNPEPQRISSVLQEEDWDYISIQQVSDNSGLYDTYSNLPDIMQYLRENATNPDVEFILHQTWAYQANSTHAGFPKYDKDQLKMYNAIVETTKRVATEQNIGIIVPSGTAIQNGRTSYLGDNFTRDGYHLDLSYGRYTAACAWFEKLFGLDVRNNSYTPNGLSESRSNVARAAAHLAVQKPYEITELVEFKDNPDIKELTKAVYIDFGNTGEAASPAPWNNITSRTVNSSVELQDEDGTALGIELTIKQGFGGINGNGTTDPQVPGFDMPVSASRDSFFGNGNPFSGQTSPLAEIEINGLNPDKQYDFLFFGSRDASDNRETAYTVTGVNEETVYLNASSNKTIAVGVENIKALADGTIRIKMTYGPNNTSASKFYYINAMKLSPAK
ncbi:DUF4886 domain-containing protein [Sphingobacterium chuzhouense]|uniref:DUF4886 domain-containing protein n=2 Tax=Sphingobacterium chuzhouense TaxID=1742264 RepID=A0ABR7XRK3_9SPHI|nr:DUF4886 domain-containing protein [Sphingobacterium chuzhouense]